MYFPTYRPRRLRRTENLRRMVRETRLSVDQLIYPMFVMPGKGVRNPVKSMPGVYQFSVDTLVEEVRAVADLNIPGVILFGLPSAKDERGSEASAEHGAVQEAIRAIKDACPQLVVMTDVCLCEYTSHGHCGLLVDGEVDNDSTLEVLAEVSLSHARAGADLIAPSDMMDGRVSAIRDALDENGFDKVGIVAYSAKYCSAFYGPFRDAADSAPQFGDRRAYQMDVCNAEEALREVDLDIIRKVKDEFDRPVAAYNVSGEYAMVKAAAANGWIDEERIMMEILTSIVRAGADLILTYFAKDAARLLRARQ